ncbi:YidH family protein [Brachybacterium conglomeratum]|uniref:YidH family protein n=1 Tax=Brachybacterium conglomeratum TaxID=47846 RepID=UPI003D9FD20B
MSADRRFPRTVYGEGEEPDPRFSLANERTFLAWLRTALAMYAAAFALEALSLPEATGWRIAAAAVFLALGTLSVVQAWIGWRATERSLRRSEPLLGLSTGAVLVIGVVIAAALVTLGLYA